MHGGAEVWPLEDQMDERGQPQQLNAKELMINIDQGQVFSGSPFKGVGFAVGSPLPFILTEDSEGLRPGQVLRVGTTPRTNRVSEFCVSLCSIGPQ